MAIAALGNRRQGLTVLITGAAGFIGFHLARRLMGEGRPVVGIDIVNDYYDPALKRARLAKLSEEFGGLFTFRQVDFADADALDEALAGLQFTDIAHLGAQAGVRYSIDNPRAYVQSNLVGHLNLLEVARARQVPMVYASSSSVYGGNKTLPFRVEDRVDHPMSLYAATKKSDELMSETYAHLYRIPLTGLRFFTVYGPWGRPDMALFRFTRNILAGKPIQVFNHGNHRRDFTYIDDVVDGVVRASDHIAAPDPGWDASSPSPATSQAPFRIFNIGNGKPVGLDECIETLEAALGKRAIRENLPAQPGDAQETYADSSALFDAFDCRPTTSLRDGISRFVNWYLSYFGIS